jgi:signal transduction histidine kinase
MELGLLQALMSAWPEGQAARLCDERGQVVAQNAPALAAWAHAERSEELQEGEARFWSSPETHTRSLSGGWSLQTRPALQEAGPEGAQRAALTERRAEAGQDVQALSRGIAHELRNPLAAILTAVGLLQDDPSASEETVLLLGVIRKESHRMNRILTEFSSYVRPRPPQPIIFDAATALRAEVRQSVREHAIAGAEVMVDDHLPEVAMVVADEDQFREVVRQILQNALEAMPQGGSIGLSHKVMPAAHGSTNSHPGGATEHAVRLCIRDSGPGLSNEAAQRAFQPFFSSKSQSTGLGLSIARSAVEASGGRIWIENNAANPPVTPESQAPYGATVAIELPLAD